MEFDKLDIRSAKQQIQLNIRNTTRKTCCKACKDPLGQDNTFENIWTQLQMNLITSRNNRNCVKIYNFIGHGFYLTFLINMFHSPNLIQRGFGFLLLQMMAKHCVSPLNDVSGASWYDMREKKKDNNIFNPLHNCDINKKMAKIWFFWYILKNITPRAI